MKDQILAWLVKLGFAALDHWLDARINGLGWDARSEARAHLLEDELIRFLEPIIGEVARKLAPGMVGKAFARAFPNDPTTGTWAG